MLSYVKKKLHIGDKDWKKSTLRLPRAKARGMLRVDTERRLRPHSKEWGLDAVEVLNNAEKDLTWGFLDGKKPRAPFLHCAEIPRIYSAILLRRQRPPTKSTVA